MYFEILVKTLKTFLNILNKKTMFCFFLKHNFYQFWDARS